MKAATAPENDRDRLLSPCAASSVAISSGIGYNDDLDMVAGWYRMVVKRRVDRVEVGE